MNILWIFLATCNFVTICLHFCISFTALVAFQLHSEIWKQSRFLYIRVDSYNIFLVIDFIVKHPSFLRIILNLK